MCLRVYVVGVGASHTTLMTDPFAARVLIHLAAHTPRPYPRYGDRHVIACLHLSRPRASDVEAQRSVDASLTNDDRSGFVYDYYGVRRPLSSRVIKSQEILGNRSL